MSAEAGSRRLTVGAVVRTLAEEFPDITISKVRFLEAEGLVTPDRTASGYRAVHRPPTSSGSATCCGRSATCSGRCSVIKDNLEALDRGLTPGTARTRAPGRRPRARDPAVPDAVDLVERRDLRLTAAELARGTGLAPAAVADLVSSGLLRPDGAGLHAEADLRVAHAVAGLAAYGVEPRHLRRFRAAADRELGLVQQVVGPRRGSDAARHEAEVAPAVPGPARRPRARWALGRSRRRAALTRTGCREVR